MPHGLPLLHTYALFNLRKLLYIINRKASADARGLPRPALCAGELLASWMPNNGLPVCAIV